MQLLLDVDLTGAKPDVVLALLYAAMDNGTRFTYVGNAQMVQATLDGSKLMTQTEYDAVVALPYTLAFAKPPVAPAA